MRELCDEDRTILLVTHALGTVKRMCDRAIWIHRGEVVMKDRAYVDLGKVEKPRPNVTASLP